MASTGKPLQIHLRPDQDRFLRTLAAREETSLAELIRRSIDLYLSGLPTKEDPVLRIVGLGRSGRGNLAERHDDFLAKTRSD